MTKFEYKQTHWADPIERPAHRNHLAPIVCAWLIAAAAAAVIVWRAVA